MWMTGLSGTVHQCNQVHTSMFCDSELHIRMQLNFSQAID